MKAKKTKAIALLTKLRDDLQNNQGMTAKQRKQAINTLDDAILKLKTEKVTDISCVINNVFKILPSILSLLAKFWGA
ncbi:MAG TPA: hypothetical protein VHE99_02065 [Gammaproteobacteria bacterium]|nr:hypothetical protein [Gammaproteobacteria bacterium]